MKEDVKKYIEDLKAGFELAKTGDTTKILSTLSDSPFIMSRVSKSEYKEIQKIIKENTKELMKSKVTKEEAQETLGKKSVWKYI